jgi:hypothetical protein
MAARLLDVNLGHYSAGENLPGQALHHRCLGAFAA